jgi:thioredoxin 1
MLTLVYNWATWCAPCRQISPMIDELKKSRTDVEIVKRDVDTASDLYNTMPPLLSVPTFWLLKDGELVWQFAGAVTRKHLEQAIEDHK